MALAQGWNGMSSGFRSAARFRIHLLAAGSQIPDRSGLPSGNRGAAAERFGFPSAVRGIAGAGTFDHCAPAGAHISRTIAVERTILPLMLIVFFIAASQCARLYILRVK